MIETPQTPYWVSLAISLSAPLGTVFAFVFGRASKSGADSVELKNLGTKMVSIDSILNATVLTVSNLGQANQYTDKRISTLEAGMKTANDGIAVLLERTKKM